MVMVLVAKVFWICTLNVFQTLMSRIMIGTHPVYLLLKRRKYRFCSLYVFASKLAYLIAVYYIWLYFLDVQLRFSLARVWTSLCCFWSRNTSLALVFIRGSGWGWRACKLIEIEGTHFKLFWNFFGGSDVSRHYVGNILHNVLQRSLLRVFVGSDSIKNLNFLLITHMNWLRLKTGMFRLHIYRPKRCHLGRLCLCVLNTVFYFFEVIHLQRRLWYESLFAPNRADRIKI